jgi:mRNA interferase YafQ
MYKVFTTNKFERDLKICKKRGYNIQLIKSVIDQLQRSGSLPANYKPHKLSGKFRGFWECHISPDWLLIWLQNDRLKEITFTNTGTHSDLF